MTCTRKRLTLGMWLGLLGLTGCWGGAYVSVTEFDDNESESSVAFLPPGAFSLVGPADGETNLLSTAVKLDWTDAEGETNYVVEVDESSTFDVPLSYQSAPLTFNTTGHIIPGGLLTSGTTFYWRVAARNPGGLTLGAPSLISFVPYEGPWMQFYSMIPEVGYKHRPAAMAPTPDGGVICLDRLEVSTTHIPHGYDIGCYKVNDDGTIDWQKAYGGYDGDTPGGLFAFASISRQFAVGPSGEVFISGFTMSNGPGNNFTMKLSPEGELVWQREGVTGNLCATATGGVGVGGGFGFSLLDGDGNLVEDVAYTTAETLVSINLFAAAAQGFVGIGTADGEPMLNRIEANGAIVWSNVYDTAGTGTFWDGVQAPDGGFFIVGAKDDNGWLLKVDALGAVAWQITYSSPAIVSSLEFVTIASNGDILASGWYDNKCWAIRADSDGNLQWQMTYDDGGSSAWPRGIRENQQGDVLIHGWMTYPDTYVKNGVTLNKEGSVILNVGTDGVLPGMNTPTSATVASTLVAPAPLAVTEGPGSIAPTPGNLDPATNTQVNQLYP